MIRFACIFALLILTYYSHAQPASAPRQIHDINLSAIQGYYDSLKTSISDEAYLKSLEELLAYSTDKKAYQLQAISYLRLGQYYHGKSQLAKATELYEKGIATAEDQNLNKLDAHLHMALGNVMASLYKSDVQLMHYLKAYDLFLLTDSIEAASVQFNIANIYYGTGSYEEAVDHGKLSLEIFANFPFDSLSNSPRHNYMSLYNTIGISYKALDQYDSAIYYLNKSFDLAQKENNIFWQNLIYGNLGSIYLNKGDYDKAIELLSKDLLVSLEYAEMRSAANAAISLGKAYFKKGEMNKARYYYDSAKHVIDKFNIPQSHVTYLESYYLWHEAQENYKAAHTYHKQFIKLRDSLNAVKNKLELSRIKAAYGYDRQVAEINLLTKNNLLQENAIEKQNIIIGASALLMLLIVSMSFYMYRNLKIRKRDNLLLQRKTNQIVAQSKLLSEKNRTIQSINENLEVEVEKRTQKLKQVNKELDTFLYRASHDIRQPIATILGIEHLARHLCENNDEMQVILEKLNRTANGMDLMLSKLQMLYQLNREKLVNKKVSVEMVIDNILCLYQDTIQQKNIKVINDISDTVLYINPDLIIIILRNIIENAIYFSDSKPEVDSSIKIFGQKKNDCLLITIEDNGYGIDRMFLDQIFNAYFKGNEHSRGNGLGLYISQKAAQALNINIQVESQLGHGSKFSIEIPTEMIWEQKKVAVMSSES